MRTIIAVVLSVTLGVASAFAQNQNPSPNGSGNVDVTPADQSYEAGTSVSATFINFAYLPAKTVVAVLGGVAGSLAGLFTGGDQRAAYALWVPTMGGDWFVRPENLSGQKPLAFFGNDYADRPSTWNTTNDATYAYDALYN
jgi:hypothetical protein